MKIGVTALILCVLSIISIAYALHASERLALAEILQNYPDLAYISRSARLASDKIARGSSWTGNSMDCVPGTPSWAYHGIHCDRNGNIDAMQFTPFWGTGISNKTFHQLSGLSYLRNYSSFSHDAFMVNAVLVSIPLENLMSQDYLPFDNIGNRTSLKFLALDAFAPDLTSLTGLTNLEYLSLSTPVGPSLDRKNLTGIGNLTNLRTLKFGGNYGIPTSELSALSDLPLLTDLGISLYVESGTVNFSSSSLLSLSVVSQAAVFDFSNLTNLNSLVVQQYDFEPMVVVSWPDNLRSLELTCHAYTLPPFPSSLESLQLSTDDLTSFPGFVTTPVPSMKSLNLQEVTPQILPSFDWSLLPNVTSFDLSSNFGDAAAIIATMCNLTRLTNFALRGYGLVPVPECFRSYNLTSVIYEQFSNETSILNFPTSLKFLTFRSANPVGPLPWDDFSLRYLQLEVISTGIQVDEFPVAALLRLSNLKSITFDGGPATRLASLPENFFVALPNLETFEVFNKGLNGTFPWYGLENLVILSVPESSFDRWPSLVGSAPRLIRIDFSGNLLTEIPDDASFSSMTSLLSVDLHTVPTLNGTQLPHFLANHPSIQEVEFSNTLMEGPMPPVISSYFLTTISMANNRICGSLPLFQNVDLFRLLLSGNLLTGTIPAPNWSQELTITSDLRLTNNYLEGTLPEPFLNNASFRFLSYIMVDNNYLEGSIPIFSAPFAYFDGGDNNFDICSASQLPVVAGCSFIHISICACIPMISEASCSVTTCPYNSTERVLPTLPYCPSPPTPIDPTPVVSCTGYIEGFVCIDGKWVSNHTIVTPNLIVPPSVGVIVVNGSLNVSGTLTFSGSGSTIVVKGCAKIGQVEIVLESIPDKTSKTPQVLIVQDDACSTSLAEVPLKVTSPKSCKRPKAETESSTRSSLSVVFLVDSSRCNTKWVILGSVLGGVVLLAAIVIAVISVRNYKLRKLL